MSNYAIVESGAVVNTIVWDGDASSLDLPDGMTAVLIPDDQSVSIGWTYENGVFSPPVQPPAPPAPPLTADQLRSARNTLLGMADCAINTFIDSGESETALRVWRQALRDVPQQTGFPSVCQWPPLPSGVTLPAAQAAAIASLLQAL